MLKLLKCFFEIRKKPNIYSSVKRMTYLSRHIVERFVAIFSNFYSSRFPFASKKTENYFLETLF